MVGSLNYRGGQGRKNRGTFQSDESDRYGFVSRCAERLELMSPRDLRKVAVEQVVIGNFESLPRVRIQDAGNVES